MVKPVEVDGTFCDAQSVDGKELGATIPGATVPGAAVPFKQWCHQSSGDWENLEAVAHVIDSTLVDRFFMGSEPVLDGDWFDQVRFDQVPVDAWLI